MRAANADPVDLDAWLPRPAVRVRHERSASVSPDALWAQARAITLDDTRVLGRMVRWRIPGLAAGLGYHELFTQPPFCVLDAGERHLVSGLVGRIWTLARDYPQLSGPDAFTTWAQPGTVRVLFGHWALPAPGGAVLVSEARVAPVDRAAGRRLRAVWSILGRFERLVGAEPLALAAERAAAGGSRSTSA